MRNRPDAIKQGTYFISKSREAFSKKSLLKLKPGRRAPSSSSSATLIILSAFKNEAGAKYWTGRVSFSLPHNHVLYTLYMLKWT